MNFRRALETMARAVRESSTTVEEIVIVIRDEDELDIVRSVLGRVPVKRAEAESATSWGEENPFG